jgi:hypothetical protein
VSVPRAPPSALDRFPWDEVRDEISPQALVIVTVFVRLVAGMIRDEFRAEVHNFTPKDGRLPAPTGEDETAPRREAG